MGKVPPVRRKEESLVNFRCPKGLALRSKQILASKGLTVSTYLRHALEELVAAADAEEQGGG